MKRTLGLPDRSSGDPGACWAITVTARQQIVSLVKNPIFILKNEASSKRTIEKLAEAKTQLPVYKLPGIPQST